MNPNEIDYGALFGVDLGGNEQDVAEPANDEQALGENEQDFAEPAGETEPTTDPVGDEPADTDPDDNGGNTAADTQPPEERARYAAARRKAEAERDAAIEQARREAEANVRKAMDEALKGSGMMNPFTKRPINSLAEFEAYRKQQADDRRERMIRKSGLSDAEFGEFVQSLPEVQQLHAARQQAEAAAAAAKAQQAKINVEEQIRQIGTLDPSIKELQDIAKMSTYPQFYELVKKGNSLVDAYKLANFDAIKSGAAAASRQATLNAAKSKQHLNRTASQGTGAVSVPPDVAAKYRVLDPTATDAEIQKHYQGYLKSIER